MLGCSRYITLLVLLSLVLAFTLGVVIMSMHTDDRGQMSDCPFSQGQAICQMGIFEHLDRFQAAFTGISAKVLFSFSLLLLLALFLLSDNQKLLVSKIKIGYLKRRYSIPIFDTFLSALSDGIIQPKFYA